jgi:transmembrane sensor
MMHELSPELQHALDRVLALDASPADHARVAEWVGSDAGRAAWLASLRATIDADPPSSHWHVDRALARVTARRRHVPRPAASRLAWLPVAAVVAAAVVIAVNSVWPRRANVERARVTLRAPVGGVHRARLDDGSTVVLASGSSLTYVTRDRRREVELVGRAAFEVVADSTRPFEVRAPFGTVTVLGTGFEVAGYRDDDDATVLVRHGRVAVRRAARDSATILTGGDQLIMRGEESILTTAGDTLAAGSWRDGRLVFRDVPVAQVARELTRWGQPLFAASSIGARRVTITLRIGALDTAPRQLALALDVMVRGDSLLPKAR